MSKTKSLHYELCCEAAKWLRRKKNSERYTGRWKWVAVELNVVGTENTDVWGYSGDSTVVVEVKTSRADFLKDKNKWWRTDEARDYWVGNYRYYLAPKGIIKEDELPENWGLLEWENGEITRVKSATYMKTNSTGELRIMSSILRRENFKDGIFNYRGQNTTIKPQTKLF